MPAPAPADGEEIEEAEEAAAAPPKEEEPKLPRVEEIATPDSPVMVRVPSNESIMTTKTAILTKPPLVPRKRSKPSTPEPPKPPPLSLDDAIAKLDGTEVL
jgi:hypothetical protein